MYVEKVCKQTDESRQKYANKEQAKLQKALLKERLQVTRTL